jgi:hypothetical protein
MPAPATVGGAALARGSSTYWRPTRAQQIAQAAHAGRSGLPAHERTEATCDLVTAAQALHWFDIPRSSKVGERAELRGISGLMASRR